MSSFGNRSHYVRMLLRDPTEGEKRSVGSVARQLLEQVAHPYVNPWRYRGPCLSLDVGLHGGDLEILLHVDGEVVTDSLHQAPKAIERIERFQEPNTQKSPESSGLFVCEG